VRAIAAGLAVIWLVPLVWALDTAFKPESQTTTIPVRWFVPGMGFEAFGKALTDSNELRWLANSLLVDVAVTALTVWLTSLAAYGLSRTQFRGRSVILAALVAGIMVPPQILIVPLFNEVVRFGIADTYWALVLPQVVLPAMVYVLKKFFDSVPTELQEAAVIDGAGLLRVYWSLMLPLSRPALAAVATFTFVTTWNNFLWPFVAVSDPHLMTFPVGLATVHSSYGVRYAQVMAAALLGGLPLVALFLAFQRQLVTAIKG
jgi:multiple sugar transport system permease protein